MPTTVKHHSVALTKPQALLLRMLVVAQRGASIHAIVTSALPAKRKTQVIEKLINLWSFTDRMLEWNPKSEIRQYMMFTPKALELACDAYLNAEGLLPLIPEMIRDMYPQEEEELGTTLQVAVRYPIHTRIGLALTPGKA